MAQKMLLEIEVRELKEFFESKSLLKSVLLLEKIEENNLSFEIRLFSPHGEFYRGHILEWFQELLERFDLIKNKKPKDLIEEISEKTFELINSGLGGDKIGLEIHLEAPLVYH